MLSSLKDTFCRFIEHFIYLFGNGVVFCFLKVEVKTEVVVGDPKEKICESAERLKADLLVMGCRAYGPIKR